MALSLEDANKVFQKARIAVDSLALNSGIQSQVAGLKAYLSQIKRNPDLQFVPINDLTTDVVVADVACKVYALVLKKGATATGAFVKASDHATASSATAPEVSLELNAAGLQVALVYPQGYGQGTGFTIGSDTTSDGSTSSTAGDGPSGFAIIGAA